MVRGEIISAGDVDVFAGTNGVTIGNIAVSAEGKITAGYQATMVTGDIELSATGEVILQAFEDTMNDDLEFAPAYITYEPVYVDVVTGYRRVEAGFILQPVVHWIPTITTEQTGFDDVKVGSEFGSVETRLFQDGYYKVGFGMVDLDENYGADPDLAVLFLKLAYSFPESALGILFYSMDPSVQDMVMASTGDPSTTLKRALIDEFNAIVASGDSLYDEDLYGSVSLSSEAMNLIAKDELSGVEQSRLNRVLIQDILPGIRELPKDEQFREYFILGVDYTVEDLDWLGKYSRFTDYVFVPWLGVEIGPGSSHPEAEIVYQLFEQVTDWESPVVDPLQPYVAGAQMESTIATFVSQMQAQPPLYVTFSPPVYYTAQTFTEVYQVLSVAYTALGYLCKPWGDLSDTEQINAIMDFLGYQKLFDMQFISEFKKTVTVGEEDDPIFMAVDPLIYGLLDGLTMDDPLASDVRMVADAGMGFSTETDGEITAAAEGMIMYETTDGFWLFADDEESSPTVEGLVYAHDGIEEFVPGLWVDDAFQVTAVALADIASILEMEVYTYTETKHYFDFWFSEFVPFDPDVHWNHALHATEPEAARAHFLPPNEMITEAYEKVTPEAVETELYLLDPLQDVPEDLFVGGELAMSAEFAAEFAAIVGSGYAYDGVYMTKEMALAIQTAMTKAVDAVADDFFIAGLDYDCELSNPNQSEYIASFFEREDAILSSDIYGHDWEKIYSPTEGLGRINRNFEGIPTATFWELDFTGAERDVVYYELDDGTDIFIRVPVDWWENYEMTTLGNERTDPDAKTLQYVGNVSTEPDETVGYVRGLSA